jgi:IS30 family transposase
MTTKYKRMDQAERDEVLAGLSAGKKAPEIALMLGRHRGTVSREISRNGGVLLYRPSAAGRRAARAASSRKKGKRRLFSEGRLRRAVVRMVRRRLSPDQVSKRLAMDYPDDMAMRMSPEAVYQYIYVLPRGVLRDRLVKGLRRERAGRGTKRGAAGETRGKLAEMLSIEERPAEVADRSVPGHWEGDLVVGARNATAVATLVERVTRYTLVIRLPHGKDAESVRKAMARAVSRLPAALRRSMTYDQGKEMAEHKAFA